jgi:hypothetical protein
MSRERAPDLEGRTDARLVGGQAAIGQQNAREALGHLGGQAQADQRAPVLAHERDLAQVQRLNPVPDPRHLAGIAIVAALAQLVGLAEADQVGREHAQPRGRNRQDHVPVQVRPGRLAVQHQHRRRVARAFVNVVQAQLERALLRDLVVVRRERVVGQVRETRVGGAQDFHRDSALRTWSGCSSSRFKGQKAT